MWYHALGDTLTAPAFWLVLIYLERNRKVRHRPGLVFRTLRFGDYVQM